MFSYNTACVVHSDIGSARISINRVVTADGVDAHGYEIVAESLSTGRRTIICVDTAVDAVTAYVDACEQAEAYFVARYNAAMEREDNPMH